MRLLLLVKRALHLRRRCAVSILLVELCLCLKTFIDTISHVQLMFSIWILGCLATRPLACLPEAKGAMLGKLGHFMEKSGTDEVWDKVASEAARTVPGRENGGNCDIKNLSRGW